MLTLLAAAGIILDLTIRSLALCKRHLLQPLLTACLLAVAYALIHVGHEGDLVLGLRSAFWESEVDRAERKRTSAENALQSELRHFADTNKIIDQHLLTVLVKAAASRVRLAVIHNGVTGLTGTGLLRYDVTNIVAAPGRSGGDSLLNQPLADWADFLTPLLADQCFVSQIKDLRTISLRAQFEAFGAASVLICPSADIQGRAVGALFVFWDNGDQLPQGEAMRSLMALSRRIGGQIATVLSLRVEAPCDDKPPRASSPAGR